MEKNINFIVKEDEKNLRVDVLINKKRGIKLVELELKFNFKRKVNTK